jgi:hypothetical protein
MKNILDELTRMGYIVKKVPDSDVRNQVVSSLV